ncbi:MAG: tRNA dihydrouridine(20/20a) synthase DusA [Gammaproteobacteria bacterium]|nr:tRNA dihydrouridine(20/20a) synthase DusA [Gammaproteobacteria bacterium]
MLNRLISIAPMMDCTDRHERYFLRLIAPHVLLYTEMITAAALKHGDTQKLLSYDAFEHPVALQLGGSDPQDLAACARLGESFGYDEINLNVGCPSERVKSGRFGACLMLEPELVADCVAAMSHAVKIPVTVKCRIGVDEVDSYESLHAFIQTVSRAGCKVFIIHARKAWLKGLSPKQNREIPPLNYQAVIQIKKDFPDLTIILNGGIKTLEQVTEQLKYVDGVMLGREAYSNPWLLYEIEKSIFQFELPLDRHAVLEKYLMYVEKELQQGVRVSSITRHLHGLFQGQPGARAFRRYLSEHAHFENAGVEIIREAMQKVN